MPQTPALPASSRSNSRLARLGLAAALALTAVTQLSGCFTLAAAGVVGGTLAAADRRTLGTQLEDRQIQLRAETSIASSMKGENVNLTVYNRRVLMTGEVPSEALRKQAEDTARGVANVREVINELQIAGAAALTSRSNDALITTKVKTAFVDARDISANAFKVTTERGVVYLMGLVTPAEGDRAAQVASRVSGVAKVVKVLETLSDEDLRRLQNTPDPKPASQAPAPITTK
ncbi:BON domain-containing protein [Piscinibacterium candidicorallinum]|uniref:BON domain-containing protein n=1 Tax=Piscinibacterium candidicorallinum TaxID=1793872 RepID=A0ABV7H7P8_9BURK